MATIKRFEEIEAWQLARELCKNVFKVISANPNFERDFSLRNQIDRSSGSVMDNIAEGYSRDGNREFIQFLSISKGSASEVQSQLYRALDRGYIDEDTFDKLYQQTEQTKSKIGAFINYLKKSSIKGSKFLSFFF
jgi:four helix bundle protein